MRRLWRTIKDSLRYLGASVAVILVRRKLKRRPQDWRLWLTLARLYEIGYQWPQAIDALERARNLNPHSPQVAELLKKMRTASKQNTANHKKTVG